MCKGAYIPFQIILDFCGAGRRWSCFISVVLTLQLFIGRQVILYDVERLKISSPVS